MSGEGTWSGLMCEGEDYSEFLIYIDLEGGIPAKSRYLCVSKETQR